MRTTPAPRHPNSNYPALAKWLTVAALLLPGVAWAQMTPVGMWHTKDDETGRALAQISIQADTAGALTGVIEKSLYSKPGDDLKCSLCTDDRKDQPKLGMELIRGVKQTGTEAVWEGGTILDPNNGKTYKLRLTPIEGGKQLQVRGYIGIFYRTQVWTRVQ